LNFRTFTGSELYVFELAKELKTLNCSVTVLSQIGGPLTDMAKKLGIKCLSFEEAPGFKLGDGKWGFNTPEGFKPSTENVLYRVSEVDFDIIHMQHKPVAERMIQFYPEISKIYSIHSEVIELENPIKHESIKKYIAIRPEIKEYIVDKFEIPEEQVDIIYNPIDSDKFKPNPSVKTENSVLFVGTIDYLRKETILDLMERTKEEGKELWLVGEDKSNYLQQVLFESHVKYFPATWSVENFIYKCEETAGIQLGRTTIEGWMCGKPSWIYKVDSGGFILSKEKFDPPTDIEKYYASNVAQQIKNEYVKIL
jgi:glycosyltransferase involved in cell wall biosynthesis